MTIHGTDVLRRASSVISTSSPGSPPAGAGTTAMTTPATTLIRSASGVRRPASRRDWKVCEAPRDAHRRHRDGSGLHHLIPLFLVSASSGWSSPGAGSAGRAPRSGRCSQQVPRPVLLRMNHYALGHGTVTAASLGRRPVSWTVPDRARPIDAELGVADHSGSVAKNAVEHSSAMSITP
jgi:hypothetical protein